MNYMIEDPAYWDTGSQCSKCDEIFNDESKVCSECDECMKCSEKSDCPECNPF